MVLQGNHRRVFERAVLFFVLFVIIIGLCGSWIVGTKLLSQGDFWVYGDKGKLFILLAILFGFIIRDKLDKLPRIKWSRTNLLYGVVTASSLIGFFYSASRLLEVLPAKPLQYYLPSHIFLLLIPSSLLLSAFGHEFLIKFIRRFNKEISLVFIVGIVLYFLTFQVWKLWPFFSGIVLVVVSKLFSLTFSTRIILPDTLFVESFGVRIAEACSGLESLFMFSALYGLIGYLDWKKLHKVRYFLTYIPLIIGLNLVNIFRVYIIILIGVLWSQDISIKLFHTYLGMVFFVIYFFLFIRLLYPRLKTRRKLQDLITNRSE